MPQAVRDGIIVVLIISGPLVLAAAFIGLVIGVLQAATQVQEQTIGSALKIIGVFTLIITVGFWMFQYLNQYTSKTLSSAFTFIPRQTQKVIPSHRAKGKDFRESFQEETTTESPLKQIKVIEPEKLSPETLEGVPPVGLLGSPEIPKAPVASPQVPQKIPEIPKIPKPTTTIPKIPSLGSQEPVKLPENPPQNNQDTEIMKINLVPEKPWQRKDPFSQDANDGDLVTSWLN